MAAKHTKLLLAALALLLATATTLAHAACSTIPNCDSCNNPDRCDNCKSGYTPTDNDNSMCTSFCWATSCQTCNTTHGGECTRCLNGYTLDEYGNCLRSPCGVSGCQTCASDTTCGTCVDGYELQPNKMQCHVIPGYCYVPNCAKCGINNYVFCSECAEGYELSENNTRCSGAVTPAGAAIAAVAALAVAVAALAL